MIKYVAKTGSDDNSGDSQAEAYLTIGQAITAGAGLVYVLPGVYTERVDAVSNLKLVALTNTGTVTIDGSGNTAAVEIRGCHDVLVDGFIITNNGATLGGWSVAGGIAIRDLNNTPGVGRNSHDITIQNCTFRDILRKNDNPGNGAQPLVINCFSNELDDAEACYNIQILDCRFEAGKHNIVGSGLGIGQLCPTGNVRDFIIDGCTFYWDMSLYGEPSTGIEMVANYEDYYSTFPDIPRRGVISNNTFTWVGDLSAPNQTYAIYAQCQDVLIENNTITRWGLGIGVVTEAGTQPEDFAQSSQEIWIRNNTISNVHNYSIIVGAWSEFYLTVTDIHISGNVIDKADVGTSEFPPVSFINRNNNTGWDNIKFVGNKVASPGSLLLLENVINLWDDQFGQNSFYTDSATPARYQDYFTEVDYPWDLAAFGDTTQPYAVPNGTGYATLPEWYEEGMFGEYSPEIHPAPAHGNAPRRRFRRKRI